MSTWETGGVWRFFEKSSLCFEIDLGKAVCAQRHKIKGHGNQILVTGERKHRADSRITDLNDGITPWN
jgi:hypothetical protein